MRFPLRRARRIELTTAPEPEIPPLPAELRERAVTYLRSCLAPETKREVRSRQAVDPEGWIHLHHHGFGTAIRNLLRDVIKDDELPVASYSGASNWDDYYVEVLEEACRA